MQSKTTQSALTADQIQEELLRTVEHLLRSLGGQADVLENLQAARDLVSSLPLTTDEYGKSANRLRNAQRYLVSDERGAARYELQMLAASLRNGSVKGPASRVERASGSPID